MKLLQYKMVQLLAVMHGPSGRPLWGAMRGNDVVLKLHQKLDQVLVVVYIKLFP
jgi:hypothetical protein